MSYILSTADLQSKRQDWCENSVLQCESVSEIVEQFTPITRSFGYAHLTVCVTHEAPTSIFKQRIFTNVPKARVKFLKYTSAPIFDKVPTRTNFFKEPCQPSTEAIWASLVEQRMTNLTTLRHTFGQHAVLEKIEDIHGNQAVILMSNRLTTSKSSNSGVGANSDVQNLGLCLLDSLRYFVGISVSKQVKLSKDEVSFLRILLASDDPEIARNKQYAFGSFETVQASIKRKFKVSSTFQALALAIRSGVLTDREFIKEDVVSSFDGLNGFDLH